MRTQARHSERSESMWVNSRYCTIVDVVAATGLAVAFLLVSFANDDQS